MTRKPWKDWRVQVNETAALLLHEQLEISHLALNLTIRTFDMSVGLFASNRGASKKRVRFSASFCCFCNCTNGLLLIALKNVLARTDIVAELANAH
jgi:hypothetical protein